MARTSAAALVVATTLLFCSSLSTATVYTVGDTSGWTAGVDYTNWLTGKSFVVGDTLVFNYTPGSHNVAEVTSSDYTTCSTTSSNLDSSGTTPVKLQTAGTHYFICGVPGHCAGGMKLAVSVQTTSGSTTPTGSSTSPPTTFTSPTTTTTFPSSSAALSPVMAVVFSGVALLKWATLF